MSEFKYACPVCGQHIRCDSSQSGTVMDCPTCLQKIIIPQAPASEDSKLIITGQQYVEKKPLPEPEPILVTTSREFPAGIVLVLLLVALAAGAAVWFVFFHGKTPLSANPQAAGNSNASVMNTATPPKKEKPAMVAPPANDTNWLLNLAEMDIPDTTAAGRVHGQDFIAERASFQNGTLALRVGTRGPVTLGLSINFQGAQAEALSGTTINIKTNASQAAPVTLRWQEDGNPQKATFKGGYALRVEFGTLAKNRLPGKLYLSLPDPEKSYLMGTFKADVRKPKPKAPPTDTPTQ